MALAGKLGAVYLQTDAAPTAFTNEATTANTARTRYTITNTVKRYWSKGVALVVKVGGVTVTTGYTLEYAGGVVVFDVAQAVGAVVTVSGSYVVVAQAGGFFDWSLEPTMDTQEKTTFQSNGWKEYKTTIKGFTVSAEAFWGDERFFNTLGTELIIVLYVGVAAITRYEGYAVVSSDGISTAVDELIQETVEFTGDGPICYRW